MNEDMKMKFIEVTKEEFYAAMNTQNVHPWPEGNWPYTSEFRTPSGEVRGKAEGYYPNGYKRGLTETRYWLPTDSGAQKCS